VLSYLKNTSRDSIKLDQEKFVVIVDLVLVQPELHVEVINYRPLGIVDLVLVQPELHVDSVEVINFLFIIWTWSLFNQNSMWR
jgi:hypothetical protein